MALVWTATLSRNLTDSTTEGKFEQAIMQLDRGRTCLWQHQNVAEVATLPNAGFDLSILFHT
jgi:hypothetical protein